MAVLWLWSEWFPTPRTLSLTMPNVLRVCSIYSILHCFARDDSVYISDCSAKGSHLLIFCHHVLALHAHCWMWCRCISITTNVSIVTLCIHWFSGDLKSTNGHGLLFFREFLMYLQRYKSFFAALPEMLCEGENVVDDATCWSGDDVVER